jgi:hypothetical protein
MTVLTGRHAAMKYQGRKLGKVQNWSLNISRSEIDESCLGDIDKDVMPGIRSATGSATLLVDPGDTATQALLNSIFSDVDEPQDFIELIMDQQSNKRLSAYVLLTGVNPSASVNNAQTVGVDFVVKGKIQGAF